MRKLVPNLKSNSSLNLLNTNSSILLKFEMTGMTKNKQKCFIFNEVPQIGVENQIQLN